MSNKMNTLISLKAEIQAQIEGQEQVEKFCFEDINIGTFTKEIVKLISRYADLSCLEFNNCKLSQLENLIGFQNVVKLRLCNNDLDKRSLLHIVEHFPNLKYLDLSGNKKITNDDLKILVQLKLTHLIIGVSDDQRATLFNLIESLCVVDHKDREGNEIDSDNDDEDDEEEEEEDEEEESDYEEDEDESDVDSEAQKKTKL